MTILEEGADCLNSDCDGELRPCDVENCSCHINPPCSACVDNPYECGTCGEVYEIPAPRSVNVKPSRIYTQPKARTLDDLDRSKIDWIIDRSKCWHSGMVVHGYCPNATTRDEILIALGIKSRPCLPLFRAFTSGGYFKVSYLTD